MFQSTTTINPTQPPKSPVLIGLLSIFLLGGVGQIQLGQTKKGLLLIIGTLLLLPFAIGVFVWILGAVDAYFMATKLQAGQSIGDMGWFWQS